MNKIKALGSIVASSCAKHKLLAQVSAAATRIVKDLGEAQWKTAMLTEEAARAFALKVYERLPSHLATQFSKDLYIQTVLDARNKLAGTKKGKKLGLAAA